MSKYLLEVGLEELPYKFIPSAISQLQNGFENFLNTNKVQFNDSNQYLMGLLETFKRLAKDEIFEWIYAAIDKYNLSLEL